MYEADYLREQIGLKFPSIFSMETPLAQIENESCNLYVVVSVRLSTFSFG
jgi:hypothetical protein